MIVKAWFIVAIMSGVYTDGTKDIFIFQHPEDHGHFHNAAMCQKFIGDHPFKIAKALMTYETLTGDELKNLLKGIKPRRDDDLSDDADKPSDDTQKSPSNKGPLPSFTKDQNFPLPN